MTSRSKRWLGLAGGVLVLAAVVLVLGKTSFGWFDSWRDNPDAVVAVNGEAILRVDIENARFAAQLSLENGRQQLTQAALSEADKNTYIAQLEANANRTDEELLAEQIRRRVMTQEAVRQGFTPTDAEVKAQATSTYQTLKDHASQPDATSQTKENYQILLDYMKVNDLTEDDYLKLLTESSKRQIAVKRLQDKVLADDPAASFDDYVDELVANAKIEYR